jgi:hypothetical protein
MPGSTKESQVTYIGARGPLLKACRQTFSWQTGVRTLVILWHDGWLWDSYWGDLLEHLADIQAGQEARILIAIFDEKPDDGSKPANQALRALLLALAADTAGNGTPQCDDLGGWSRITDFERLSKAGVLWCREQESSLLALSQVAASLGNPLASTSDTNAVTDRPPRVTPAEFFHFLEDPATYRTQTLHDATKPEDAVAGLRLLKWLGAAATYGPSPKLKVLIIENKPEELAKTNKALGESLGRLAATGRSSPMQFLHAAEFYLVKDNFDSLGAQLRQGEVNAVKWDFSQPDKIGNAENLKCSEIDLVLQDIVLGEEGKGQNLSGLDLAPEFYQACPQALIFLITNLDVETLVGSGDVNWKYVDCIISKQALATLWYEYRRCFRERFGRMFWADWGRANDKSRNLLRNLFGSLRRWQIEPDILWHGQTLPEMIDHANRHVSALWKLVNDVLGTLMENGGAHPKVLSLRHRIALAVAVWMHDVGHRGDEYFANSMDIRAAHAGISERLLLRNPEAYGLAWLLEDLPHEACRTLDACGRKERLACRNRLKCAFNEESLCLLRETGLLCRHHQSNAPLDLTSLQKMAARGKEPSVYSLVADEIDPCETDDPEKFLLEITNDALPPPSPRGVKVRTLDDFATTDKEHFRAVAGVMRMLDALQIHRARVGSLASIRSFQEFLDARFEWCKSERLRLEDDRRAATPGKKSFQRATSKLDELGEYEILLNVQGVHYWRQAAVHEVEVLWRWKERGGASLVLEYRLDETALDLIGSLQTVVPGLTGGATTKFDLEGVLEGDDSRDKWRKNFEEEVFGSEHDSQYGAKWTQPVTESMKGYLGALLCPIDFQIKISNSSAASSETLIRCSHG